MKRSESCEPGPGSYDVKYESGLAFSMKGKNWKQKSRNCMGPGPATYRPDYKLTKFFQPGKTIAGKLSARNIEEAPGPGAYLIKFNDSRKGWTIARKTKDKEASCEPGPGAYTIKSTICEKPGKTMAGKSKERNQ